MQQGGDLIEEGNSVCVLRPNLPCDMNDTISKNKISKLVFGFSEELLSDKTKQEIKMNQEIQKIKDYKNWAIVLDNYCKTPPRYELSTYDPEGIKDCYDKFDTMDYDSSSSYDKSIYSYMMNAIYGGKDMDRHFTSIFSNSKNNFSGKFLKFMKQMKPLFHGLVEMKKNKIVHNDIKPQNIVLHNGKFKYIDFGLSLHSNQYEHFKSRSIREFKKNKRIYIHYPLDYLYFYLTKKQLQVEHKKIIDNIHENYFVEAYKNHIDNYQYIQPGDDYLTQFETIVRNKNKGVVTEDEIINGIDVYGLGMCVPFLIEMRYGGTTILSEIMKIDIIKDFMKLFHKMIHPYNYYRISAEKAKHEFEKLLNKYNKKRKQKQISRKKQRLLSRKIHRQLSRKKQKQLSRKKYKQLSRKKQKQLSKRRV